MDVYKVTDLNASKAWLGFVYLKNESGYDVKHDINLKLKGLEIFNRDSTKFRLSSGEDDIIILIRVDGSCSYSIGYSNIPRDLSEAEMILKAK